MPRRLNLGGYHTRYGYPRRWAVPAQIVWLLDNLLPWRWPRRARRWIEERVLAPKSPPCRVYWGSHGCDKKRGHRGAHACGCCDCDNHKRDHEDNGCVAKPPYYGPGTRFYGEDAERLGLPLVNAGG